MEPNPQEVVQEGRMRLDRNTCGMEEGTKQDILEWPSHVYDQVKVIEFIPHNDVNYEKGASFILKCNNLVEIANLPLYFTISVFLLKSLYDHLSSRLHCLSIRMSETAFKTLKAVSSMGSLQIPPWEAFPYLETLESTNACSKVLASSCFQFRLPLQLPNLKTMKLWGYYGPPGWNNFISIAPNLKSLNLRYCNFSETQLTYFPPLLEILQTDAIHTTLLESVVRCCEKLQVLTIDGQCPHNVLDARDILVTMAPPALPRLRRFYSYNPYVLANYATFVEFARERTSLAQQKGVQTLELLAFVDPSTEELNLLENSDQFLVMIDAWELQYELVQASL